MTMDSFVYRKTSSKYFDYPAHIMGLDYYEENSAGEHDFSRKQVWFYVYGDDDIEEEFSTHMSELVNTLQNESGIDWDLITLMPSHAEGDFNSNMDSLLDHVSGNTGIDYSHILHRNHTIRENHDLDTIKEKVVNSEGSLDVIGDVDGKNIILVDNVSSSGCSLMHAVELLKKNGASSIACLTIGVNSDNNMEDQVIDVESAGKTLKTISFQED